MKKIVVTMMGFIVVILLFLIGFTIHGRSARQTELENAMTSSMEKTMQILEKRDAFSPQTDDELCTLFIKILSLQMESVSDLTVTVIEADAKKGILSAEGILTYMHPIGTEGNVTCRKTIILEEYTVNEEKEMFAIQFIADGKLFKIYNLSEGSSYINPGIPESDNGDTFTGWTCDFGTGDFEKLVSEKKVEQSITFIAQFE